MKENEKTPSKFESWILASRPKTLLAPFAPVMVGTSIAVYNGVYNIVAAMIAIFCSVLITVGTNFVNDLYDFLSGKDTAERKGPTRVLAAGLITEKEMRIGIYLVFGLTFFAGLYLVSITGYEILIVGVISILAGIAYTAGPFPLAYNGLGDIFVFLFFGLVATVGTYYVQAEELNTLIFLAAVPVGLLITNILVVNNYRDIDEDRTNSKNTLAVLLGRSFAKGQYISSIIISYVALFLIYFHTEKLIILLPILLLPLAIKQIKELFTLRGEALNDLLASTAKFSALFGLLLSLGFIL